MVDGDDKLRVYIGTGGYTDTDLVGALYPNGTKKSDMLSEYAKRYTTVEINSSFYAPIAQKAYQGMLDKSAGKLLFSIKLHQSFSHSLSASADTAWRFISSIEPICQADKLACLLVQFPHGFDRTDRHRRYLAMMVDWFDGLPLAVEFRHSSWHTKRVISQFCERGLIWGSVDYPDIQGLPKSALICTHATGYLRLHGKNKHWWDAHSASERHDYRYTVGEMQALARQIHKANCQQLFVYFQNTTKAHSVYNIQMLQEALDLPLSP